MKKLLTLVFALVLCILPLAACGEQPEDDVPTDPFGLAVSVKNVTDTGLTFVFKRVDNGEGMEYSVGNAYRLERDFYGRWIPVENILEEGQELVFTTEAYVLPVGNYEMNIDWAWAYGNLKPGTYPGLTKGVTAQQEGAAIGAFSYSATFVIEGETE